MLEVEEGVMRDWLDVGSGDGSEDVVYVVDVCTPVDVATEIVAIGRSEKVFDLPLSCMLLSSVEELGVTGVDWTLLESSETAVEEL